MKGLIDIEVDMNDGGSGTVVSADADDVWYLLSMLPTGCMLYLLALVRAYSVTYSDLW